MYIVKITTPPLDYSLLRQTPNEKGIWGNFQFFINDDSIKECDYWIVCEGLVKEEVTLCPSENVILITREPSSIKKYNEKFLKQFNKVLTSNSNVDHRNIIYWQHGQSWHIGKSQKYCQNIQFAKNYDWLKKTKLKSKDKNKICSVISSNKNLTKGHRDRINFVETLKNHFGDRLDIFGRGFNEIEDKWDAIAPYKYHIVLENCSFDDYWTEKLSDAFLAEAYPIYYGANNIFSYFDKNSLTKIDIHNPKEAIEIIEEVISGNYYERSIGEIIKSKNKVLNEYNLFPTIISKIIIQNENKKYEKNKIVIKPEIYFEKSKQMKARLLNNRIIKKVWLKYRKLFPRKNN